MFFVSLLFIMFVKCLNMYKEVREILLSEFKKAINMGLGSAILELKNQNTSKLYNSAVLYACLHNTCYDPKFENERHNYLYRAVKLINDDTLEDKIIEKLFRTNSYWLINQLCGLLYLYAKDDSTKAFTSMENKLDRYFINLPRKKNHKNIDNSMECAELIALWLCELGGIKYFLNYMEKIGEMMEIYPEKNIFYYNFFMRFAKDKFGKKRVLNSLTKRSYESHSLKSFLNKISDEEILKEESLLHKKNAKTTYKILLDPLYVNDNDNLKALALKISQKVTDEEILFLANRLKIDDGKIKLNLMMFFAFVDYPYDIKELLDFYDSSYDENFKAACLEALGRFKDPRLHEIAILNIRNKILIPESLGLLIKNFNNDYAFILEVLEEHKENSRYDFHSLVIKVIKIFENRKCKKAQDILIFAYKENTCSSCRTTLVDIMCKNNIITDEILNECLYDCSEETRKLAENYQNHI